MVSTAVFWVMLLLPGSTQWAPIAEVDSFKKCLEVSAEVLMWYNKRTTWEQPRIRCELAREEHK